VSPWKFPLSRRFYAAQRVFRWSSGWLVWENPFFRRALTSVPTPDGGEAALPSSGVILPTHIATTMATHDHRNTWDHWYGKAVWQHRRMLQLIEHPLCAICARKGWVSIATVVDHVQPHRGDWTKFKTGAIQSLCKLCHDTEKKTVEIRGYSTEIGLDGWPRDPTHPAYTRTVMK